jgi:regulator of sigma E protease
MLGGVTVNLILGFLIYMMILFVWGKKTLNASQLPMGLEPSPIAQALGFELGDQILEVDGKPLDNVLEINKHLFLRGVETVAVQHQNGTIEQLSIPENFGKQMFESGELLPFTPVVPNILDSIIPNSPAAKAGLLPDDKIVEINGNSTPNWTVFKNQMTDESRLITLVIERDGRRDSLEIATAADGTLGVYPKSSLIRFQTEKLSLSQSISEGFSYGYWTLYDYVAQFQYLFTQKGASQLGGFGAIGNMFPSSWNWKGFWASTALISIILAFMNILPIPALDGGHVMFLIYEMITGRKPNDQFLEYAQMFGFFLLLSLVLYANGNDLYRLLFS